MQTVKADYVCSDHIRQIWKNWRAVFPLDTGSQYALLRCNLDGWAWNFHFRIFRCPDADYYYSMRCSDTYIFHNKRFVGSYDNGLFTVDHSDGTYYGDFLSDSLGKIGGVSGVVENVEPAKLQLFSGEHTWVWALAYLGQTFFAFNTVMSAPRYLAVTEGKDAKKVAYLVAALFIVGPPIWFLPPIAASHFFPNIAEILPQLKNPQDAAYVLIGLSVLPKGLAGLLVMVVFAATLSIMDSSVNQNAALISLNLYKPFFRPNASEREMFIVSRIFNVVCGAAVTTGGLLLAMQGEMALFDLMLFLSGSLILPIAVPCVLIYWVKKTPHWSAVVSVLLSMTYSIITFKMDVSFPTRVWGTVAIGVASFFLSGLFWKSVREETKTEYIQIL